MHILGLILGVIFFVFAVKLIYHIGCMLLLPPGHPRNVAARRERWQEQHPGKKSPFRF